MVIPDAVGRPGIDENVFTTAAIRKGRALHVFEGARRWRGAERLSLSAALRVFRSTRPSAPTTKLAMRFNLSASRFKPYIGAQHIRTRTRPTPEIDTRAARDTSVVMAGSSFNLTERTAISASAQWDETTFDEGQEFHGVDLAEGMSHVARAYSGGFRYAVTPFTTMSINGASTETVRSLTSRFQSYRITPRVDSRPKP